MPGPDCELVTPEAGFVIKSRDKKSDQKVFINVVKSDRLRRPLDASGKEVSDDHLDARGMHSLQVPLDVQEPNRVKDARGATAMAVDVIFHPSVVNRALSGHSVEYFQSYVSDLAVKFVESNVTGLVLTRPPKLLRTSIYKGGVGPRGTTPRPFPVEVAPLREDAKASSQPRPAQAATGIQIHEATSVISDEDLKPVSSTGSKKKAVKKGFLQNTGGRLYPNGSTEGTPPPGAGDPLGYLPPGLRSKVHVVGQDATGNPDQMDQVIREYADKGTVSAAPGIQPGGATLPKPAATAAPASLPEPAYTLTSLPEGAQKPDQFVVTVELPGIAGMADVDLDISSLEVRAPLRPTLEDTPVADARQLELKVPQRFELSLNWPRGAKVDPDQVRAQFRRKAKTLTITAQTLCEGR